jgi:enhancing lycopene biosynthesis protein 2
MARIAVILHGCGARDGSEVHEATLTLLALDLLGASVQCFAPTEEQAHVVDHLSGKECDETRWMHIEAARIARGKIKNISDLRESDFDGIVIPGGSGTAVNLCSFAHDGAKMKVNAKLEQILREFHKSGKPIGAICIAPVILAKVFGSVHPILTIGNDAKTAAAMQEMGAKHQSCDVESCVVDRQNLLVTTPAYMLAQSIRELWPGIQALCQQIVELAKSKKI